MKKGTFKKLFSEHQNLTAFIICIAGVVLNLLCSAIVSALKLPLYLDTVGTITVAVIGGYLPGVTVGFITNILKSISDPSSLYYGTLNVIIAFFATLMADHGWFKKIKGILGAILVFTLIGGGLGSLIPLSMDGLSFDSESLCGILYETGFLNLTASHIISGIIMDLADKILTVLTVVMIIRIIPEKYYHHFSFRRWMQTPISEDEALYTSKNRLSGSNRVMSLKAKVLLVLSVSLITVAVVGSGISRAVYQNAVEKEHTRIAQGTATIAADVIDGDRVDIYLSTGGNTVDYKQTKDQLMNILKSSTDIEYLYVYKILDDGCHVVFDLDVGDTPAESIGTVIPFDEGFSDYLPALLSGERIDPIITNDKYGHLLTAYEPVYDSTGSCVCYVGADVNMDLLSDMERSFLIEMVSIFSGFFILLLVFVAWLLQYHVIFPINTITECVNTFSENDDTQKSVDSHVKDIRHLDIKTGDEIETMYRAICGMSLRQAEQMRNIRRLSESTAKMQDGLIITMADMVENRDSDTGAHIQKTAAYVKIIVEGLYKKGYYSEKITKKFMSDVVRSAPLHDVGKINISDGILNKPGKLTDEEYEIMKTHTTAGKKIMEDAISTVKGENYLKEARNMAAYHHERWDGKGYPEGLHGEVIPLSARIMAVADVFDALTSPRVYKPAFPLEKALAILEEGRGTQFDPKCVGVFMDNLAEVKVILSKYNHNTEI